MLAGIFFEGSGLGDQLHRYITVRTLAEEKEYEWGMVHPENFKGASFMQIDMGKEVNLLNPYEWNEKDIRDEHGVDVRSYDPEINFVEDNTIIDGYFEDEKYWGHNLTSIREWLQTEPLDMPDNVCVIGFRGGEYKAVPDLYLTKEYWEKAIHIMREKYPGIQFEIHSDDTRSAMDMMHGILEPGEIRAMHSIGLNWRSVRYAKHLIIANSAFYILPSLLGDAQEIIAPRYWARRNTKTWARPACYYKDKRFLYI